MGHKRKKRKRALRVVHPDCAGVDVGKTGQAVPRAIVAGGRGGAYVEKGIEQFESERRDRQLRHLQRQARRFNLASVEAEEVA